MSKAPDNITHAELKSRLWYYAETGAFRWRFRTHNGRNLPWSLAGSVHPKGYVNIKLGSVGYRAHRLAWLYVHGTLPAGELDHINGNRADNRIVNLRVVDRVENCHNRHVALSKTSGVLGVSWHKATNKWVAQTSHSMKKVHLGLFTSKEAAVEAYRQSKEKFLTDYHKGKQ